MDPALITAVGGLASAGLNALSQARTNAVNRQQAEYAFSQQQAAIDRMNEYNSPSQQVLRMKAAGLNPSLAYGADGAMVGNQSDVPAYNPIPSEAPNIGNIGSTLADSIRTGIEVKDLERRNALAVAEIALKDAQSFQSVMNGNLSDVQRQEILTMMGYKIENLESATQLNWDNVLKARAEVAKIGDERKEIQSKCNLNEQQVKTLAAQAHLSEIQAYAILQRLPYELLQMDADTALSWVQSDVGRATFDKINREISHIGFVEWANNRDFDFNKESMVAGLEMRRYESKVNTMNHVMDNVTRIISFGIGVNAMSNGRYVSPQRYPSPVITPAGGSMFGQNWKQ